MCVRERARLFLKTSRIFRKTGNRHGFFRLPARKRAANLTISSARRVFLEPAGYKSNGRNVSLAQRRLPRPGRCYRNVEHILSHNQCRLLQPFNAFKPFCESYKWIDTTEQMALKTVLTSLILSMDFAYIPIFCSYCFKVIHFVKETTTENRTVLHVINKCENYTGKIFQ